MEVARKKPRVSTSSAVTGAPSITGLPQLPATVVSSILRLLLYENELLYVVTGRYMMPEKFLRLATVCKDWYALVDELASEYALQMLELKYEKRMTRSSMLHMRRQFIHRRVFLRQLVVRTAPIFASRTRSYWAAALSHAPLLQSLDLSPGKQRIPPVEDLVLIIEAAAQQCPMVEKVSFPTVLRTAKLGVSGRDSAHVLVRALFKAMQAWRPHGGLRELSLGLVDYLSSPGASKEFFEKLVAFCPKIQELHGYYLSMKHYHYVKCKERWMMDLETWERFCRTCDQLKGINWITLPFATDFFEIFGKYPKPQLKSLTLTTARNWSWTAYFREVGEATQKAVQGSGYGQSARNIHKVVEACPNLRQLTVDWYDHVHGQGITQSMDCEVFGDDFFESVARHCKKLTALHVLPLTGLSWTDPQSSILTLTDRSFEALATLSSLTRVSISGANVTGHGLFELVVNHASDSTKDLREYKISVGDCAREGNNTAFYSILAEFLERLIAYEGELPCAHRPMSLRLVNLCDFGMNKDFSAEFLASAQSSVEQIKQKHATVAVKGIVGNYNEKRRSFRTFKEFYFTTGGVKIDDDASVTPSIRASAISDDFVSHVKVGAYADESDDEDDEDDDESTSGGEDDVNGGLLRVNSPVSTESDSSEDDSNSDSDRDSESDLESEIEANNRSRTPSDSDGGSDDDED